MLITEINDLLPIMLQLERRVLPNVILCSFSSQNPLYSEQRVASYSVACARHDSTSAEATMSPPTATPTALEVPRTLRKCFWGSLQWEEEILLGEWSSAHTALPMLLREN